jgi:hypothetical protein
MDDHERFLPRFARDIRVFGPTDSLRSALEEMHKHDYSQVVVRMEHSAHKGTTAQPSELRLLSYAGIARYFAACWNDDYVDIKHLGPEDLLDDEPDGTMVVKAGDSTVGDARASLVGPADPHVHAVLITDTGDAHGQPLGIVTPWDLREDAE